MRRPAPAEPPTQILDPGREAGLEPPEQPHPSVSPLGSRAPPPPDLSSLSSVVGSAQRPLRGGGGPDDLSQLPGLQPRFRGPSPGMRGRGVRGGSQRGGVPGSLKGAHQAGPTQSSSSVSCSLATLIGPAAAMPKCPKCDKEVYFGELPPAPPPRPKRGTPRHPRGSEDPGLLGRGRSGAGAPGHPEQTSRPCLWPPGYAGRDPCVGCLCLSLGLPVFGFCSLPPPPGRALGGDPLGQEERGTPPLLPELSKNRRRKLAPGARSLHTPVPSATCLP